jgi:hypothetical protein
MYRSSEGLRLSAEQLTMPDLALLHAGLPRR